MERLRRQGLKAVDRSFWRLVSWELRHLYGRRSRVWQVALIAAGVIVGTAAWWAAAHPEEVEELFLEGGGPAVLSPAKEWLSLR